MEYIQRKDKLYFIVTCIFEEILSHPIVLKYEFFEAFGEKWSEGPKKKFPLKVLFFI